jgi:hypothetical protein
MGLNGKALDIECFHFDRPVQAFLSALESAARQDFSAGICTLGPAGRNCRPFY